MNNVLIVGNNIELSKRLKFYLKREGYKVYCTKSIKNAVRFLKKSSFQLVILNSMLLDIQVKEACRILRHISDVHIFVLGKDPSECIECLEAGADDYLVRPICETELIAKVKALFRRLNVNNEDTLVFDKGKLKINYENRKVLLNEEEVYFTPNEFDILYILALNKGKAFSREELIDKIFGIDYEGFDRVIDVHIKNIRKKIEEDSKKPKYIKTINRVGYKFGDGDIYEGM